MAQIYCYCFKNKVIWHAYQSVMGEVLAREFGDSFKICFLEMDDQQKAESSYKLKLDQDLAMDDLLLIKQEFQLFKYNESTNTEIRLFDIEHEILNKF